MSDTFYAVYDERDGLPCGTYETYEQIQRAYHCSQVAVWRSIKYGCLIGGIFRVYKISA